MTHLLEFACWSVRADCGATGAVSSLVKGSGQWQGQWQWQLACYSDVPGEGFRSVAVAGCLLIAVLQLKQLPGLEQLPGLAQSRQTECAEGGGE